MGTCQYEHEGKKTCNIDTSLFKDSSQKDLFHDFCYFHQTTKVFDYFYTTFKGKNAEVKEDKDLSLVDLNKKINQILLFFLWFLGNIPKPDKLNKNFQILMETKQDRGIDLSGFYFPVTKEIVENVIKDIMIIDGGSNWNNKVIWKNIKGYDLQYIQNTVIKDIIVSEIFRPVIGKALHGLYYANLLENSPFIEDHILNNNLSGPGDEKIAKYIFDKLLDGSLSIPDIINSQGLDVDDIIKKILVQVIKDIDIESILNLRNEISPNVIKYIKSLIDSKPIEQHLNLNLDEVKDKYKNFPQDKFSRLLDGLNKNGLIANDDDIIKTKFQKITFNQNIKIVGRKPYSKYLLTDCQLKSKNIIIQVDELELSENHISDRVQHIGLSVPFRYLDLSQQFSEANPLFSNKTNVYIYDGYDDYNDSKPLASKEELKKGNIQYVNLENVRFYWYNRSIVNRKSHYGNLEKLNFVHCKLNEGHKLYEDTHIAKFPQKKRAEILKRLEYNYRYLRKHYDEKGDYIEGNDFHYNYMEAKKRNSGIWDKLWLYPYGWLNGYNTKPGRAIVALLVLIIMATFINACSGSFAIKDIYDAAINNNKHDVYASFIYSSANIIPLLNKDTFIPKGTVTLQVTMIENLLGPILIALLVMALRNRFRRSKSEDEFK